MCTNKEFPLSMKLIFSLVFCAISVWAKQTPTLISRQAGPRIVGGQEARVAQFPFIAALNVQTSDSTFFCGGALISTEWVLTSGHCVNGAISVTVRLGSNTLTGSDPNRITAASSNVVPHPDFDPIANVNDIGLVKLRLPVELGDYVQPIRLATSNLPNSANPTAIGWGQLSDDDPELASDLQFVGLAVVSNAECGIIYGNQINNNTVCVDGNFNEGTCYGDTGSPLVVRMIGSSFIQHVGVASFFSSKGCESTDPSGFTRTYPYNDWIRSVTGIID